MKNKRLLRSLALLIPLLVLLISVGSSLRHAADPGVLPEPVQDSQSQVAGVSSPERTVPAAGEAKKTPTTEHVQPKEKNRPRQVFKLLGASTGRPLVAGSAHVISEQIAGREVKGRTTRVDVSSFAALTAVKKGEVIAFPLNDQEMAQGTVDIVLKDEKDMLRVAGPLGEPARGRFCFAWNGTDAAGMVLLQDKKLAYLTQKDAAGNLMQQELLLSAVMCVDFTGDDAQAAASPPPAEGLPPPPVVPVLNSRPSAVAVLYLDFDGETVTEPAWLANNTYYQPFASLTEATITDLFNRVREDYAPFDVNITTERSRYDNAPTYRRMRCIITPDIGKVKDAAGSLGVAFRYSFATQMSPLTSTVPCWVFTTDPLKGAQCISHEFGHTLGLTHDNNGSPDGYYPGHGGLTGPMSWSPIMGSAAGRAVDQWSRGQFIGSTNNENDLAKIASTDDAVMAPYSANGITFVPDEDGGTLSTTAVLATSGATANQDGIISQETDADLFSFRTNGGSVTFTRQATADNPAPNLDVRLEILNSSGTVLVQHSPADSLMASVSTTLTAGTYFLKVSGVGVGDPYAATPTGYTSYGSIGRYTIIGSGALAPNVPTLIVASASVENISTTGAALGGSVVSDNGSPITARGVVFSPTSANADPYLGGPAVVNLPAGGTTGSFTIPSGVLSPGTRYSFRAYATNSLGTSYTLAGTFTTLSTSPTVTTPSVANVTGSGALLGGTVESDGGSPVTFRGVVFSDTSLNPDPDVLDLYDNPPSAFLVQVGGTTGGFSAPVTGLSQGTSYSFKAFAINNQGVGYTPVRTFTTPTAPAVGSSSGSSSGPYSAYMSGILQSDNGSPIVERGVYYARASVNLNPQHGGTGVTKVLASTDTAEWSITASVGSLLPNTTYAFRPYATNAGGIGYGPVGMVTTTSQGPFAGTADAYPAATGAELNGVVNGFGWDTAVTFSWGTTAAYGQTVSATPSTVTSGNVSVWATLTGLARHTTYHYRVNATSSKGTTHSQDRAFTTTNEAPVATGQGGLRTPADTPVQFTLAASDADGDPLTYAVSTQAAFGTAVITGNIATYTPTPGYNGTDSFKFTASDSYGGTSAPATIGLSVGSNNTPPALAIGSTEWPLLRPVINFTGTGGATPGAYPDGGLTQGRDGHYYGTTAFGGTADLGTVFRLSPAGVLTPLVHFTGTSGTSPGSYPWGGLIQARDGSFYGTTSQGGAGNLGTIFRMTPQGVLTTLVTFTGTGGGNPGSKPRGRLVQAADGHFYGMTSTGGAGNTGTVFKMTAAGLLTTLVSFPAGNGINPTLGDGPAGSLIQSSDGSFYGLTPTGGTNNVGTAFKVTSAGVMTTLASFDSNTGAFPQGSLVQDGGGTFYGVTWLWGDNNLGTVFSMTSTGVITRLFSFTGTGGMFPGGRPYHGLVRGRDGNFYGVTTQGGSDNWGTIFKMTSSGEFTQLSEIRGASGPLLEGTDGGLYGTVSSAGGNNIGGIYRYGPPPVVVTAAEGATATRTGTFSDAEGNATVTLTASVGTITQNNAAGTWSWSATGADGPSSSIVTITATDSATNVSQAVMTFDVTNAPPVLSASGPATGRTGVPVTLTFTATDPSPADQAAGFNWEVNYGDYTNTSRPAGSLSPQVFTHTFANPGTYQVTGSAYDRNGGWTFASHWITIQSNRAPVVRVDGAGTAYSFSSAASLATARFLHTATVLTNGKVLVVGSGNSPGTEVYDPGSDVWDSAGNLAIGRYGHTACLLPNGKVLVLGGSSYVSGTATTVESYDPAASTWTTVGNIAMSRSGHTATLLNNGKILIVGGWDVTAVETYDPGTNAASSAASLSAARYGHTATLLGNGKVLVVGGYNSGSSIPLASTEIYDPVTNLWSSAGSLPQGSYDHTATLLSNGKVLIAGGRTNMATLGRAMLYDPATNSWAAAGSLINARTSHTATLMGDGKVFVTSGLGSSAWITTTELYDPATNTWAAAGSLLKERYSHTASLLRDGRVLIAGGEHPSDFSVRKNAELATPVPVVASGTEQVAATQTGTFSDPDGNGTTMLTASRGTILQDNALGTWIWTAVDTDGPVTSMVTITGTDDAGATASAPFTFTADNLVPLVSISAPLTSSVGAPVNYTFAALDASQQDQTAGFAWSVDFGDGTGQQTLPPGTASPAALTHTFASAGEFTARLTATDKDGGVSAQALHRITILGLPQVAALAAEDVTASAARLGGQVLSDGGAAITERGVVYAKTSEDADPLLGGAKVTKVPVAGTTGFFATTVTGLTPNTTYTFRAYATNSQGTSHASTATFTTGILAPTVTGIAPADGSILGGTPVTISGTDFTGATGVTIGGAAASNVVVINASTLTAVTGAHAAGTADVVVTTPSGSGTGVGLFTYTAPNTPPALAVDGTSPGSGTFTATPPMSTARNGATATLLADGTVLLAGGEAASGHQLQTTERFSPSTQTWTSAGSMTKKRRYHTATRLLDGRVLVAGGEGDLNSQSTAEIYNPATGAWAATGSPGMARTRHTATLLPDGKVLIAGGDDGVTKASAELYDPATGTWSATGSLGVGRIWHTSTRLINGTVLVIGGDNVSGNASASAELYDPATGTWTATASLAGARAFHSATLLPDGKVLVAGGYNDANLATAEVYNPVNGTWSSTGSLATGRQGHAATGLVGGKVLVYGGYGGGFLSSAELYDPSAGTWAATGSFPAPNGGPTATLLLDGKVLAAGGFDGSYLASAALYDGPNVVMVSAAEGSGATQTGTFSDVDGLATVTLTASTGTVTQNNTAGTWSWSPPAGFDGPSSQQVAVTATDSATSTATTSFHFTAANTAPASIITAPSTANEDTAVNFTFTAVDGSAADQSAGFAWALNFGDGTTEMVAAGTLIRTHTFAHPGTYNVTATATDRDGATSAVASRSIIITSTSNADLSSLVLSAGNLAPAFASSTTSYTTTVAYSVSSITLTAFLADPAASLEIRLNGGAFSPLASGVPTSAQPLNVGTNIIHLRSIAQDGITTKTCSVSVTRESEALSNWNAAHFGGSTANTAAHEDFDGDGIPNLLEFAFGTSPSTSSSSPMQFSGTFTGGVTLTQTGQPAVAHEPTPTGTDYRAVFVRRVDHEAAGLIYTVRFSADLITWQTSTVIPTVLGTDGTHEAVSVPYPLFIGGKKARFFTIGVDTAP